MNVAMIGPVVLSLIGCGGGAPASPEQDTVRELGQLQVRLSEVDQDIVAIQPEQPATLTSLGYYAAEIDEELPRYLPIQEDILAMQDAVQDVEDADIRQAADLLVEMVEQRYDGMKDFVNVAMSGSVGQEASRRSARSTTTWRPPMPSGRRLLTG